MRADWTPEEEWLAAAFDEIGPPRRSGGARMAPARSGRRRYLLTLAAGCAVGALTAGAILVPRALIPPHTAAIATLAGSSGCRVKLPGSWLRAARHQLGPTPVGLHPFAVSPSGGEYFAWSDAAAWEGVVEVGAKTGAVHKIAAFPEVMAKGSVLPTSDSVGGGSFDGRWLVWTENLTLPSGSNATSIVAWDSSTGVTTVVSHRFFERPVTLVQDPARDAGLIAFAEQPERSAGSLRFQLYSLRTGEPTTVLERPRQESFGGAFFWAGRLVLDLGGRAGESRGWHLEAVSLLTGGRTALPGGLGSLGGLTSVAASSSYVFGIEQRGTRAGDQTRPAQYTIEVLRGGATRPTVLVRGSARAVIDSLQFGHYLTWREWPAKHSALVFVADLRSGAYAAFPGTRSGRKQAGFVVDAALGGGTTLVTQGSSRSGQVRLPVGVLHLGRLPSLGSCH